MKKEEYALEAGKLIPVDRSVFGRVIYQLRKADKQKVADLVEAARWIEVDHNLKAFIIWYEHKSKTRQIQRLVNAEANNFVLRLVAQALAKEWGLKRPEMYQVVALEEETNDTALLPHPHRQSTSTSYRRRMCELGVAVRTRGRSEGKAEGPVSFAITEVQTPQSVTTIEIRGKRIISENPTTIEGLIARWPGIMFEITGHADDTVTIVIRDEYSIIGFVDTRRRAVERMHEHLKGPGEKK